MHLKSLIACLLLFALVPAAGTAQQSGIVVGVLIDSLRTQLPVSGAEVTMVGAGLSTRTDANGGFAFHNAPIGNYAVIYMAMCGLPLPADEGIALGEIRDSDGRPSPDLPIRIAWEEIELAVGVLNRTAKSTGTVTSMAGWYTICGVPLNGTRTMIVNTPQSREHNDSLVLSLELGSESIRRRDVILNRHTDSVLVSWQIHGINGAVLNEASAATLIPPIRTARSAVGRDFEMLLPRISSQLLVRAIGHLPRRNQ